MPKPNRTTVLLISLIRTLSVPRTCTVTVRAGVDSWVAKALLQHRHRLPQERPRRASECWLPLAVPPSYISVLDCCVCCRCCPSLFSVCLRSMSMLFSTVCCVYHRSSKSMLPLSLNIESSSVCSSGLRLCLVCFMISV